MGMHRLLIAELWHRKLNVALSLFALLAAATLFVAGPTLLDGYQRESDQRLHAMQRETEEELGRMQQKAYKDLSELDQRTKRIMRDMGFNLRIVHRDTDLTQLYAKFTAFDMPEEYVKRLAESPLVTKVAHLVATLRQIVEWEGKTRLLVGFAPEAVQSHVAEKSPMGLQIKEGSVYLGALAGEKHSVGETVDVLGKRFEIARILPPHGTAEEDIAICMHLKDAQQVLNKPGKISEILALGCQCKTVKRVEEISAQLEAVLPEARVTELRLQAIARDDQRKLVEAYNAQAMADYKTNRDKIVDQEKTQRAKVTKLLAAATSVVTPLVVFVCAVWVGLLAWSNVRERRNEIGLLRALGKGSVTIASLFLGKAALLGFVSGVGGCLLGSLLARWLAAGMFEVAMENFAPSLPILALTAAGTPLVAAMASYLPTLLAVNQDPAVVLMEN